MSHVRQQIREAVAAQIAGLTTTGARVFPSRVYPLARAELPCLLVYAKDEQSEIGGMSGSLHRDLTLVIEGYARATQDLDDTLDTIAAEVETAMAADTSLGGVAKRASLAATDITLNGEGEQKHGVVSLEYAVVYRTAEAAPQTAI